MIPMTLKHSLTSVLLGAILLQPAFAAKYWVYTGTYTRGPAKGIYAFSFDPATGAMGAAELKAETSNPSWLTVHPNGKFLYAVNEHQGFGKLRTDQDHHVLADEFRRNFDDAAIPTLGDGFSIVVGLRPATGSLNQLPICGVGINFRVVIVVIPRK